MSTTTTSTTTSAAPLVKKPGRGGARPGAGRPPASPLARAIRRVQQASVALAAATLALEALERQQGR